MAVEGIQTFDGASDEDKAILLKLMDYSSDGKRVLKGDGSPYVDPFTGGEVLLSNMAVFPGSWIVIDYNPASINGYIAKYGA